MKNKPRTESDSNQADALAEASAQARAAYARGDIDAAIRHQEQAVALARAGQSPRELFIQLFSLGQFYAIRQEFDQALSVLTEAMLFGTALNHPQLETARQIYETVRRLPGLSPEERARVLAPVPPSKADPSHDVDEG